MKNVFKGFYQAQYPLLSPVAPVVFKIVCYVPIVQLVLAVKLDIHQPIVDNRAHNAWNHAQFVPKLISRCVLDVFQENIFQDLEWPECACYVTLAVNNVPELITYALAVPQDIILEE